MKTIIVDAMMLLVKIFSKDSHLDLTSKTGTTVIS